MNSTAVTKQAIQEMRDEEQRKIAVALLPSIFAVNLKASETTTWCVETALHAADILLNETGWRHE